MKESKYGLYVKEIIESLGKGNKSTTLEVPNKFPSWTFAMGVRDRLKRLGQNVSVGCRQDKETRKNFLIVSKKE